MGRPIELVMARQWSALLTTPTLLFDDCGALVYFNQAAALVVGRSFSESGSMAPEEWHAAFRVEGADGKVVGWEDSPLARALASEHATQHTLSLRGMDGQRRVVTLTSFPIRGLSQGQAGVLVLLETAG
ncbi:MAG TPA: hypothetical protein QGF58_11540 [Myxococcota bacterium]|nr:hypothetical protein [Myxococcota bacterium]